MRHAFFIVGPTATGKSELATDVAREIGADALQIYRGLDLLTAKPDGTNARLSEVFICRVIVFIFLSLIWFLLYRSLRATRERGWFASIWAVTF